jgi:hypothetical protein
VVREQKRTRAISVGERPSEASSAMCILSLRLGFLSLAPGTGQSAERDPQKRISGEGDEILRRLLVSSAHYILGPFALDSGLRRHGEKLAERGGKNAKKRAVVVVARKLSVVLYRLWVSAEVYEPLRNARCLGVQGEEVA